MEERFTAQWLSLRAQAAKLGIRLRSISPDSAMQEAHRSLRGHRPSDGFDTLFSAGHPQWTLEALAVDRRYTGLFSDEEANTALTRLLEMGYRF